MRSEADKLAAQRLLRDGQWLKTRPEDCGFFIGDPATDPKCRRCGSTWERHVQRATGRA
jgi:hypothetical protein